MEKKPMQIDQVLKAYAAVNVRPITLERQYMDAPNLCQAFLRVTRPTDFDCSRTSGLLVRREGRCP
jgi:hypothetical protein